MNIRSIVFVLSISLILLLSMTQNTNAQIDPLTPESYRCEENEVLVYCNNSNTSLRIFTNCKKYDTDAFYDVTPIFGPMAQAFYPLGDIYATHPFCYKPSLSSLPYFIYTQIFRSSIIFVSITLSEILLFIIFFKKHIKKFYSVILANLVSFIPLMLFIVFFTSLNNNIPLYLILVAAISIPVEAVIINRISKINKLNKVLIFTFIVNILTIFLGGFVLNVYFLIFGI